MGAKRAREATGAIGRQHVVGAGGVVAEGGRAIAAGKDAASSRNPVCKQGRILLHQLQVLRSEGVGKVDCVGQARRLDEGQGSVSNATALASGPLCGGGERVENR